MSRRPGDRDSRGPGVGRRPLRSGEGGAMPVPAHADVAHELRVLREKGLLRLRHLDLPVLAAAAGAAGFAPPGADDVPSAVEDLLRAAVRALGDDEAGLAA